jgi:hypothetical protein
MTAPTIAPRSAIGVLLALGIVAAVIVAAFLVCGGVR